MENHSDPVHVPTITKPLILILFGIIAGAGGAGIMIAEALHILHELANIYVSDMYLY